MTAKRLAMAVRGSDSIAQKAETAEAEPSATYSDNSAAKKIKLQCNRSPSADLTEAFGTTFEEAVREISVLFSKYSEVLRERVAMDASQVEELENILTEALSVESQLKEKKEHLRRSLALISDKLQG